MRAEVLLTEDGYQLQGIVRYALGIYHRVIPDFFLLRWMFGISGDIDVAVAMHEESFNFATRSPCALLMYSVAMLCKTEGDPDEPLTAKAHAVIDEIMVADAPAQDAKICQADAQRVRQAPDKACGYTKAKQQETDEDAMKEKMKKDKQS